MKRQTNPTSPGSAALARRERKLPLAGLAAGAMLALALLLGSAATGGHRSAATPASTARAYGRLPLAFEPNAGQASPAVRYVAHGAGYVVALTNNGALLRMAARKAGRSPEVRIRFVGGSRPVPLEAQQRLRGKVNYLIGSDRSRWHTGIPTFASVLAKRMWPGIDVAFNGNQRRLEYSFQLAPGADPRRIRLVFPGARYVRLGHDGALSLGVGGSEVLQPRPSAYQLVGGGSRSVAVRYVVSHGQVRLALGGFDRGRPLVIDPALDYSTYLGGSNEEHCGTDISPVVGTCIAADSTRRAYITGMTESTDFPTTSGAYQTAPRGGGGSNAFVAKLTPDGSALEYSTYIAGTTCCVVRSNSIAVDSSGAAYIAGDTNENDFPTTPGAYVRTAVTGAAYVTKLSPDGSTLDYSTYLCSDCTNWEANAITVDSTGHAYAGGWKAFPAPLQVFVDKLNPTGSGLDYEKFFGGSSGYDYVYALALDSSNNVYATGTTQSSDFPTTSGAYQRSDPSGNWSAFVTKLDTSANIVYSTYLAGNSFDWGQAIAVDASGAAYVTGITFSSNFPTTPGAYQRTHAGGAYDDAFVTKLSPDGSTAEYSTYLGGDGVDIGSGIAVDSAHRAIVVGQTGSTNFPTTAGALQRSNTFGLSAFATAVNPQGSAVEYSTYLGDATIGKGIALDSSGAVYLGGEADVTGTGTGGLPTTPGAFHTSYGGGVGDAFVAKFHPAVVLSVAKRGSGAGTVTSSPGTINCGRSCSQAFTLNDNVKVTLRASSMPGSTFTGWSGACSGSGTCTLTMNADRTVTATFTASPTPARLTQLKLTPTKFRAAGHGASISASKKPKKKRPPVGTKVSYRDTRAATTRFTVQQATAGVQQGRKCVRPTKKHKRNKKCTRWVLLKGSFTHADKAGSNSFRFSGRLSKKTLPPGSYRLYAVPAVGRLIGKTVWVAFTIVR